MPTRKASAEWKGGLKDGEGNLRLGSGAYEGPYSFRSRFEEGHGTNPEELIAAAHLESKEVVEKARAVASAVKTAAEREAKATRDSAEREANELRTSTKREADILLYAVEKQATKETNEGAEISSVREERRRALAVALAGGRDDPDLGRVETVADGDLAALVARLRDGGARGVRRGAARGGGRRHPACRGRAGRRLAVRRAARRVGPLSAVGVGAVAGAGDAGRALRGVGADRVGRDRGGRR